MRYAIAELFSFLLAIVGLAALATLVSRKANTPGVLNSMSSAVNTALATAEAPVSGYSPGPPIYASGAGFMGMNLNAPSIAVGG